jgi:hypothetical protein
MWYFIHQRASCSSGHAAIVSKSLLVRLAFAGRTSVVASTDLIFNKRLSLA